MFDFKSIHFFVVACTLLNYVLLKMLTYKTHKELKMRYVLLMPVALYSVYYIYCNKYDLMNFINNSTENIKNDMSDSVSSSRIPTDTVSSILSSEFKI